MFKKLVAGAAVTIAASTLVTALPAASVNAADKKVDLKELNVQFVPSSQADTIQAKAKPLEKLLKAQLGIPVHVTISTDYNTVVEAMGSKKVTWASCHLTHMYKLTSNTVQRLSCNHNATALTTRRGTVQTPTSLLITTVPKYLLRRTQRLSLLRI